MEEQDGRQTTETAALLEMGGYNIKPPVIHRQS